ncbi:MAG: tRNA 2-thiouridine(34) synthase MnmA [Desulfobacteraceae bacterium]|jgi:tRNA-specific 2-thiouridylase
MPRTIAIALSGGIDSLMTAVLLKEQGLRLFGVHFLTGFEPGNRDPSCGAAVNGDFDDLRSQTLRQLTPMVDQLDIPLHIIDLRAEFKSQVVDYFVNTYQEGKTPNPCLKCNPSIKFDTLFEKAKTYGATHIATGHYAQLKSDASGRVRLLSGIDPIKDQSYFLSRLRQEQLHRALFPLGAFTKDQTRQMAKQRCLTPAACQESQDICFIKNGTYGEFLKHQPGFSAKPGPITNAKGHELGRHPGLHLYTIGQRRGINCPAAEPYYVIGIDPDHNRLIVGLKKDLRITSFEAYDINWIVATPRNPTQITVRVRYRHQAVPATLNPVGADRAQIVFDTPHPGVTPGQGAVFYHDNEVLGGGWIR